jgi:hypothetical protein
MDCQLHQRYLNQFRAMFVMGISVDWHKRLVYNDVKQALVTKLGQDNQEELLDNGYDCMIPHDLGTTSQPQLVVPPPTKEGEYFSVGCANCGTQVAALDMKKNEVYYFHGCLESSATGTFTKFDTVWYGMSFNRFLEPVCEAV